MDHHTEKLEIRNESILHRAIEVLIEGQLRTTGQQYTALHICGCCRQWPHLKGVLYREVSLYSLLLNI